MAVASEVVGLTLVAIASRREGLLPSIRYLPVVAAGAAAMGVAILAVPGPTLVEATVGSVAYLAVVLALPGTVREVVFDDLVPALRGR